MSEATPAAADAADVPAADAAEVELPELEAIDIPDTELVAFARQQVADSNRYFVHVAANWDRKTDVKVGNYDGPQGPAQGLLNLVPPPYVFDESTKDSFAAKLSQWQDALLGTVRDAASVLETDDDDDTVTVYVGSGRSKINPLGFFPMIHTDGPNKGEQVTTKDGRLVYRLNFRTRIASKRNRTPATT